MAESSRSAVFAPVILPLALLLALQVAASGSFVTMQVAAPEVARAVGLPVVLIGVFTTLSYAGSVIGGTLTTPLMGGLGVARACQATLVGSALALAATTIGLPAMFAAGALMLGISHGPTTPLGSHVLMRRTPPAIRSSVFSLKQAGVPLGGMLAGALVPVVAVTMGWRAAIFSMAAVCVAGAAVIEPWRHALDDDTPPPARGPALREMLAAIRIVLDHPPLRELVFASCIFGAAQWCFTAFYVAFLVEDRGMTLVLAGIAFSVAQGGGIVGRVLFGVIADRSGRPIELLVGLGIAMAAASGLIALTSAAWPPALILLAALAMGVTALGWNGVLIAEIARIAPDGRVAAATGGFVSIFAISTMVFPLLFAGWILVSGYEAGFVFVAVCCLVATWRLVRTFLR